MHPVIQGFVESVQISRESASLLEAIQEIRSRPIISVAVRSNALRNLDLIQPFSALLESGQFEDGVDLYASFWGNLPEKEITLLDFLIQKAGSFSLLSNTPASKGFYLATGAKELILGSHLGFLPFHRSVATSGGELSLQNLRCFEREFPDLNPLEYFKPESLLQLYAASHEAKMRFKMALELAHAKVPGYETGAVLERYLDSPPGDCLEISRTELRRFGLPVRYAEEEGIQASMRDLQSFYTSLVCMSTNMEGTHQFPHGQSAGGEGTREFSFKARAELQAIVESVDRRFICFRVMGLPPEETEEVVWIQK